MIKKFISRVKKYGLRYVCAVILQNKIYRPLDKVVMKVSKKALKNKALKDVIIIESHNDFDSNGGVFYNYLIEHGYNEKYKIVWLLRNKKPGNLPKNVTGYNMFKPSFLKAYYFCLAKYMSFDHVLFEKVRDDQKTIYCDHGSMGLKAFKGKIILPENLDYCLCPSEFMAPIMAEQYLLEYPNEKQVFLGYPIHDVFYNDTEGDLKKLTDKKYDKVVLWMPTFRTAIGFHRKDSDAELPLGIPIFRDMQSYKKLNDMLREKNVLLILKIHPMQDMTTVKIKTLSNIMVLDGQSVKQLKIDNYRLMKDTDALISDYSSVAYDYLCKNKPIAYTLDDMDDYNVGFIVEEPKELMAGHLIYTQEDFIEFIDDVINNRDPYAEARSKLFDKVFKYHDGSSCERIAKFLGL